MWMPRSITSPSTWWNIGVCVASLSDLYVRPGAMMRIGGGWLIIVRICTGEVCVRSSILCSPASARSK